MSDETWVKLYRKEFESEMHKDHGLWVLYTWLLAHVTHKRKPYVIGNQKIDLLPGQRVTSYKTLARATGLTVKQARNRMLKLKKFKKAACKGTNKYLLVTLTEYEFEQGSNKKRAGKRARYGHAMGTQRATKQEGKKEKKRGENGLHPLSDDFGLTERLRLWAEQKELGHYDLEAEMEKFKAHYFGNGELRSDWNWVWKKWMIGCYEKGGALKQNSNLDDECPLYEGENQDG
jgi:hypothetical protein